MLASSTSHPAPGSGDPIAAPAARLTQPGRRTIVIAGAGTLALFSLLCVVKSVGVIERDIQARTLAALQAAGADWPELVVRGRDVDLLGAAPSDAEAARVKDLLAGLRGVRAVHNEVSIAPPVTAPAQPEPIIPEVQPPPPATARLTMRFDGLTLGMTGVVADDEQLGQVLQLARLRFTELGVKDDLEVFGEVPDHWADAIVAALEALVLLEEGEALLEGENLAIRGIAPDATALARLRAGVRMRLPAGYASTFDVRPAYIETPLDSAGCQAGFDAILANIRIRFDTASAVIAVDSHQVLDQLARIAARCPGTRIEIGGHTDDQGTRSNNLALSQRRAEAVMEYLSLHGIPVRRLTARGYGEDQPITDNATADERARNRRIEFRVLSDAGETR